MSNIDYHSKGIFDEIQESQKSGNQVRADEILDKVNQKEEEIIKQVKGCHKTKSREERYDMLNQISNCKEGTS